VYNISFLLNLIYQAIKIPWGDIDELWPCVPQSLLLTSAALCSPRGSRGNFCTSSTPDFPIVNISPLASGGRDYSLKRCGASVKLINFPKVPCFHNCFKFYLNVFRSSMLKQMFLTPPLPSATSAARHQTNRGMRQYIDVLREVE
jgi:hypothetical protein